MTVAVPSSALSSQETRNRRDIVQTAAEIDALATLPKDWDGEGAEAISSVAIARAKQVLIDCATEAAMRGFAWLQPLVGPTADGEVEMSWRVNERRLLIIIDAEADTLTYCRREGANTAEVLTDSFYKACEYVTWVLSAR